MLGDLHRHVADAACSRPDEDFFATSKPSETLQTVPGRERSDGESRRRVPVQSVWYLHDVTCRHSDVLSVEAWPAAEGENPVAGAYVRCRRARFPDNAASLEAWHYRGLFRSVVAATTSEYVGPVY